MNEIIKTNEEENNAEIKPWSRLEGEPSAAYGALEIYLALGPSFRSLQRVAGMRGLKLFVLKSWSSRWDWCTRAALYDEMKHEIVKNEVLTEIEVRSQRVAQRRLELSELAEDAYADLFRYLKDYWAQYQDPEIVKKIRFISNLTSTLNRLLRSSEVSMTPQEKHECTKRNIRINQVLNLNNDLHQVSIQKANLYNIGGNLASPDFMDMEEENRYPGDADLYNVSDSENDDEN